MTRLILHLSHHDGHTAPGNPRRMLIEQQAHLEATGNPEVVRIARWNIYETTAGALRPVRTGESVEHPDAVARMVAAGWVADPASGVERFIASVEAGRAYDPFAGAA